MIGKPASKRRSRVERARLTAGRIIANRVRMTEALNSIEERI